LLYFGFLGGIAIRGVVTDNMGRKKTFLLFGILKLIGLVMVFGAFG
jgi:hypothetical protein